ncbi:hypothetical protein [Pedobacter insulae]|uniref:Uncharacterized protein n=1 Tax=Pedobacter insulae TaxID=414048 RepID=A0A1I2XTA5_9SPHI|nr:hypothetical protein [Pedobacter insulae]SFH16738.1 hypothetical protein SAMN04489864_10626 [Pedobacter insulae]
MKTSYKILIAFATLIFTSLIICNISLKAKYKNGEFDMVKVSDDIFQLNNLKKVMLKDFKHVVINGAIITKNNREITLNPNFRISSNKNQPNTLGLNSNLKSILKQRISHDTLYISFQKNKINEDNLRRLNFSLIILQTNNLQSLSAKNLNCTAESLQTDKSFLVTAEKSGITLNYIHTESLTLKVGNNSSVTLLDQKITTLNYDLARGSSLNLLNRNFVGKINCLNPSKNISETYFDRKSFVAAYADDKIN